MTKNDSRIIVFTTSSKNTSKEEYREALLRFLQIHFNRGVKGVRNGIKSR